MGDRADHCAERVADHHLITARVSGLRVGDGVIGSGRAGNSVAVEQPLIAQGLAAAAETVKVLLPPMVIVASNGAVRMTGV